MTKLKLLGGALIFLTTVVWGTAAAYDAADINGAYGFASEGTLTVVTDATTGQSQTVPTASVVRFVANGLGQATLVGTTNLGGFAIINLASTAENSATYSVNADTGLGVMTVPVRATALPELPLGVLPPGFDASAFEGDAEYELYFVIIDKSHLKLIGTKLSSIDGTTGAKTPIGALVISGSAMSQTTDSTE